MEKSEKINELIIALVEFHKEVGKITKNAKNPFFKSSYGDLNSYLSEIKDPLVDNGLAIIQLPTTNGLTTILSHTSGQYISENMTMQPSKNDPQGQGSALTYMRRYSLASILNLNAQDDDGNEATRSTTQATQSKKNPERLNYTDMFAKTNTIDELKDLWSSLSQTQQKEATAVKDNRKEELSKTSPIDAINKLTNESELKPMYEAILQEKDTMENYMDVANAFNIKADQLNSELNLLPF